MFQQIRQSLGSLRRAPGLTAISVVTVALGVGAGTALFSVVKAVLLNRSIRARRAGHSHERIGLPLCFARISTDKSAPTTHMKASASGSQAFLEVENRP